MSTDGRVTGDAASLSRLAPAEGTIRLRLSFAGPRIQKMMAIYIILLFVVSGTALDLIGYDHSSIGGSPLTKIHVSTYFIVVIFAIFII